MTNNDINNKINENENIDAVLEFFKTPEYQKKLENIRKNDEQKAHYASLIESTTRNGGIYHVPSNGQFSSSEKTEKLVNKTIGNNKKVSYNKKKPIGERIINIPNSNKVTLILCSALMVVSLAVGTYALAGEEINDYFQTKNAAREEYNNAVSALKNKASQYLCDNFLAIKAVGTDDIVVKENTVADYGKLDISNPLDVYIYSLILPRSELPKFIQSVSYQEYGYERNYVSIDQFLRINGMLDKKTGHPSSLVFENMMEKEIRNIPDDMIKMYLNDDNLRTFSELISAYEALENNNSMGGK